MKKKYRFKTTKERSELMSKIGSKDTKPEIVLRKMLWNAGIRYRKNVKSLPGTPDIVIRKHKLILFVDGEFWHGHKWEEKKEKLKANKEYWIPKIEKNMVRDHDVTHKLEYMGFRVMRFWQQEIEKNPGACYLKIMQAIENEN